MSSFNSLSMRQILWSFQRRVKMPLKPCARTNPASLSISLSSPFPSQWESFRSAKTTIKTLRSLSFRSSFSFSTMQPISRDSFINVTEMASFTQPWTTTQMEKVSFLSTQKLRLLRICSNSATNLELSSELLKKQLAKTKTIESVSSVRSRKSSKRSQKTSETNVMRWRRSKMLLMLRKTKLRRDCKKKTKQRVKKRRLESRTKYYLTNKMKKEKNLSLSLTKRRRIRHF